MHDCYGYCNKLEEKNARLKKLLLYVVAHIKSFITFGTIDEIHIKLWRCSKMNDFLDFFFVYSHLLDKWNCTNRTTFLISYRLLKRIGDGWNLNTKSLYNFILIHIERLSDSVLWCGCKVIGIGIKILHF